MRRRDFMKIIGGAAAGWPLPARAQQRQGMRRIGVLISALAPNDPQGQARITAFVQGLQQLGWTDGRNVRIDIRWGLSDADRRRKFAGELVALEPDVILAGAAPAVMALQQATRTVPIVFANVVDPVGLGYVASLARPGGNTTGFMNIEFGLSGKSLELLKQIAPQVTRVAVLRNSTNTGAIARFGAIQAEAPSFGVELTPIDMRDAGEIEQAMTAFVRGPNDGLIMDGGGAQQALRDLAIRLAARHRL